MLTSVRKNPCPSCGRTKDGDCRFNDEVILCHSGESGGPNPALRIGEVVNIEGRSWALVKTGAGHSGSAHVFKPHQPKRQKPQKTTRTGRQQEQQAKAEVASIAIERFFDEFKGKRMAVGQLIYFRPAVTKYKLAKSMPRLQL